jgi:hypothetical protein
MAGFFLLRGNPDIQKVSSTLFDWNPIDSLWALWEKNYDLVRYPAPIFAGPSGARRRGKACRQADLF